MVVQLETPILDPACSLPYPVEGLVQVFTCSHRSFFTNVMAQALRIAGQGTSVLVVQFLKGGIGQGHERPIQMGRHLDWIRCDLPRYIDTPQLDETEARSLLGLWQHTQKVVFEGKYSLVVLDELSFDVILTGPEMPQAILDVADQITEIRRTYRL